MTIKLSKLLASARGDADGLTLEVPEDWMQGRSVFGGLQTAIALRAMRELVPETPLRMLQTTFVAPIAGTLRVRACVLRQGKNATHVEARIVDGDNTQALIVGAFGRARGSAVSRRLARPQLEYDPARVVELPFGSHASDVPSFTRHFSVRWLRGQPPFTSDREYQQVLELAIDDDGPTTEAHIIALADFIPPIALSHLSAPTPGSTLSWMLEPLVDRFDRVPLHGFRVDAELVAARDGYTSQSVRLYASDGEPLALSRQHMLVFG